LSEVSQTPDRHARAPTATEHTPAAAGTP
jgi:hypothetical protein